MLLNFIAVCQIPLGMTVLNIFRKSLSEQIKDELAQADIQCDLDAFIKLSIRMDRPITKTQ